MPSGRPKKQISELPDGWQERCIELRSEGRAEARVWKEFGISQGTHERFLREDEEYREIFQYAKVCAESYLSDLMLDNIKDKDFKYPIIKFMLCAHYGYREQGLVEDDFKSKQEMADEEKIREKYKLKAV